MTSACAFDGSDTTNEFIIALLCINDASAIMRYKIGE